MDVKVLDKWAELLLDMGKRNNLVNFKNAKMGTAEIVAPDFAAVFRQAEHGATFEVYDPHLEEDDDLDESVDIDVDLDEEVVEDPAELRTLIRNKQKAASPEQKKAVKAMINENGGKLDTIEDIEVLNRILGIYE